MSTINVVGIKTNFIVGLNDVISNPISKYG